MGAGLSSTTSISDQKAISNLFQQISSSCPMTSTQKINGAIININGGSGDVGISQTMSVSMSCVLDNAAELLYNSLLQQKNDAEAKNASAFLGVNADIVNVQTKSQAITTIRNAISTKCGLTSSQIIENVIINVNNHTGNVSLSQDNSSVMNCAVTAVAKAHATLTQTSTTTATAGASSLQSIIYGIIMIVVVIVVGVGLYFYFKKSNPATYVPPVSASVSVAPSTLKT